MAFVLLDPDHDSKFMYETTYSTVLNSQKRKTLIFYCVNFFLIFISNFYFMFPCKLLWIRFSRCSVFNKLHKKYQDSRNRNVYQPCVRPSDIRSLRAGSGEGETVVFIPLLTFGADPSIRTSEDLDFQHVNQTIILRPIRIPTAEISEHKSPVILCGKSLFSTVLWNNDIFV